MRRLSQTAGLVFHVINRGARRARLFDQPGDYRAFLQLLAEARSRVPLRLLAYCVMPNHFHLVVWPNEAYQMSRFMWWLTTTHSKRWHVWRGTAGTGPVYQGRFRAFPVQADTHFLTVCRYVERNPLRANLVARSEDWLWSSLSQRARCQHTVPLDPWPVPTPQDWLELVNGGDSREAIDQVRRALIKSIPYGTPIWANQTAQNLGIPFSSREPGRPKKTIPGVVR